MLAGHIGKFGNPYKYGNLGATSDLFERGESEQYGSGKYSSNPRIKTGRKGIKRNDIYTYEAEQQNDIETWYRGEANSALCRTRVDIRAEKSGADVEGVRWTW
jgi:hypothetical protein